MGSIVKEVWNQKQYLVAGIEEGECLDEDCLAAVSGNGDEAVQAEGILPVSYVQLMDKRMLRYDVNAYLPYAEYKKEIRRGRELCEVLLSVLDTLARAEAYLLEPAYFLLKQEYVYIKPETGKAWLGLYPVYGQADGETAKNGDLTVLFQDMIKGIRLQEEDMAFYGKLTYELDQGENFSRVAFGRFLTEMAGSLGGGASAASVGFGEKAALADYGMEPDYGLKSDCGLRSDCGAKPDSLEPRRQSVRPAASKRDSGGGFFKELFGGKASGTEKNPASKGEKSKGRRGESETEKAKGRKVGSETEKSHRDKRKKGGIRLPDEEDLPIGFGAVSRPFVLQTDDEAPAIPSTDDELPVKAVCPGLILRQSDTGERIPVTRFPFEIGREGSGLRVDLSKTKVSRRHAVILETAGGYAIRDISKHGTFLDGKRIPKDQNIPLKNGTRILLKEIEYVAVVEE